MKRLQKDHPPKAASEPVHRVGTVHDAKPDQRLIYRPETRKKLLHADGANKRRYHHRHQKQPVQNAFARKLSANHRHRQR